MKPSRIDFAFDRCRYQAACWMVTALIVCLLGNQARSQEKSIRYNQDVRPILSDKCFYCHGPDEEDRQADLRLDLSEAALESAIVSGNPAESEFVRRIAAHDLDMQMPPPDSGKSLTKPEIDLLTEWIRQGAKYEPYWAYVPPRRSSPDVKVNNLVKEAGDAASTGWTTSHVIDRSIQTELRKRGLVPAPEADSVTLLRRLYFDLTGLPPRPEAVRAFVDDPSPAAYEKVVDQLLASQAYGERMAVYWLDLVRYADTVGYHGDQEHHISPYRDWVINAFNENLPFDQFTREQLAGDLLPEPTVDQLVATGYNRMLQTSHEGGVQAKEYLAIYAADRVRNLSAVWMGATVGCAQCHNHKYDPYTIHDFYALAAFFADVDESQHFKLGSDQIPTRRPPEMLVIPEQLRARFKEIAQQLEDSPELSKDERDSLLAEKKVIESQGRLSMITVSIDPREMRVLPRGNWLDESGPVVHPEIPAFLGKINDQQGRATRLDLANWLVDPDQGVGGLTARVQVNRFWYLLFGTGISRSLDDFGGQGEPPTYPELLDELALQFIESGWNIKAMMQQIVLSDTYRQSSITSPELRERDPENRLFARQGRYRLPAEMVRDNALSISGLLISNEVGGKSSRPYQPEGYYRHLNFPKRDYESDTDGQQYRRGVYTHWQRQFLHPMLKAFDAPSREECTAQRPRSNTPLAALVLLNDPTFVEAARAFAAKTLSQPLESDQARLEFAFERALSRKPDAKELDVLEFLLVQNRHYYSDSPADAEKLLAIGLWQGGSEFSSAELAAWTSVARAILNLDEAISRN